MVPEQDAFLQDLSLLLQFCKVRLGYQVTGGELYRTLEQEKRYIEAGLSELKDPTHNLHTQRLAIDLNFFFKGQLLTKEEQIRPAGDYWKSLNPKNKWGGEWKFKDLGHFERRPE